MMSTIYLDTSGYHLLVVLIENTGLQISEIADLNWHLKMASIIFFSPTQNNNFGKLKHSWK